MSFIFAIIRYFLLIMEKGHSRRRLNVEEKIVFPFLERNYAKLRVRLVFPVINRYRIIKIKIWSNR